MSHILAKAAVLRHQNGLHITHRHVSSMFQRSRLQLCSIHRQSSRPSPVSPSAASNGESRSRSRSDSESDDESFPTVIGDVQVVDSVDAETDPFLESTQGNLHFGSVASVDALASFDGFDTDNFHGLHLKQNADILTASLDEVKLAADSALLRLGVVSNYPQKKPQRAVYCNRTTNLRSLSVVAFDMDYTLVNYSVQAWEGHAYRHGLQQLKELGVPTEGLQFDPSIVIRGLILDTELGNLVKADRFGFIKRAVHGLNQLGPADVKRAYNRELINLRDRRWQFLNTFFSVSEACLFMQLVDRLDAGLIPHQVCPPSYPALYQLVSKALFQAHVESSLKAEIIKDPSSFITLDPEAAQVLLDFKYAGKQLVLITNSDYNYTHAMMSHAYDRYLPAGMTWVNLFDTVIINARKPEFFSARNPLFEVVSPDGLLRPANRLEPGGIYCGGSAEMVEEFLGVKADDIMYMGDHIYTDASLAKLNFRWRTCLILRELEEEITALALGRSHRVKLKELLNKKDVVGDLFNNLRLARQRMLVGVDNALVIADDDNQNGGENGGTPSSPSSSSSSLPPHLSQSEGDVNEALGELILMMQNLDREIVPAVERDGWHFNKTWGYLSKAGVNDRSQLMRQVEKNADLFTSRVSNFGRYSPFQYFRAPGQSLPHDRPSADEMVLGSESEGENGKRRRNNGGKSSRNGKEQRPLSV